VLDLGELERAYAGRGSEAFHPALLLALLIYGYATGVFSSRKLERASYDSVAFRYIAANTHPDHDTINAFRKRFLVQLKPLFVQVLQIARELGMLKLGTVALDGSKVHANASRHSALSFGHANRIEAQLKAEVEGLLCLAVEADIRDKRLAGASKLDYRLMHAKPITERYFAWVKQQIESLGLLPSNPMIGALNYSHVRRWGLEVYLTDPDVPIDNNHLHAATGMKMVNVRCAGRVMKALTCSSPSDNSAMACVSAHRANATATALRRANVFGEYPAARSSFRNESTYASSGPWSPALCEPSVFIWSLLVRHHCRTQETTRIMPRHDRRCVAAGRPTPRKPCSGTHPAAVEAALRRQSVAFPFARRGRTIRSENYRRRTVQSGR
jgi:transposase